VFSEAIEAEGAVVFARACKLVVETQRLVPVLC
jgi:hypothetical protein